MCIGERAAPIGTLTYVRQGQRENSAFAYDVRWLEHRGAFNVSPDLKLIAGHQTRKAASKHDSVFPFAFADTEPDAWGRRVIARDHAKRRQPGEKKALTEMDYLLAVDDASRVGALRLRDNAGHYLRAAEVGKRSTPPLLDLQRIYVASRAVERGTDTAEDLKYLQGKGTSLGGMRPKCTILDKGGRLAIGNSQVWAMRAA